MQVAYALVRGGSSTPNLFVDMSLYKLSLNISKCSIMAHVNTHTHDTVRMQCMACLGGA